jgi:methionyl-tRNA formyltransferase
LKNVVLVPSVAVALICDNAPPIQRDVELWNQRTGGKLGRYELSLQTRQHLATVGAPVYFVENHNSAYCVDLLRSLHLDVLINSGTPRKLNAAVLTASSLGVLNAHPGQLPQYRGCSAVEWSLLNNDGLGNTIHFMNERYDEGPILRFQPYHPKRHASYQEIRAGLYEDSGLLIADVIRSMASGEVTVEDAHPQDENLARHWDPIDDESMQLVLSRFQGA